ncbi:MAG TPA: NAD(P)H-dependent glycerol-3-phosphate dehydrogenase [Candidatus Acidoferrales bacterium]|nr:NAD(P)H-dependent glycerol-3-phosphate dehydrogenase [Candidatus Acidoferrales bacterium]
MAKTVGVIGAGGWGTALAKLLCERDIEVTLWCRGEETYRNLVEKRENSAYLPGVAVPPTLAVTCSLEEALRGREILICAVPSHGVRAVMRRVRPLLGPRALVVCATKGIEEGSLKTMGEVLTEELGQDAAGRLAFLSGPTFASEVARGLPAAATVAAASDEVAHEVQSCLSTQSFRTYTSRDIIGVQMGGAIKNVIALAAGISDGLELGANSRAALITRGLAEMTRLAVRMGAEPLTLAGLSGLGDLVLTCTGDLSRNRRVGIEIGRGRKVAEIVGEMRMVAEGVKNTGAVYRLAQRLGVEMPIVEQMQLVLNEGKSPVEAVPDLMQRSLKAEHG